MRTKNLRRQHDAAIALANKILAQANALPSRPDWDSVRPITIDVAQLTGLLKIHFALEDQLLYPSLQSSAQPDVATLAQIFIDEMGDVGPAYLGFAQKWSAAQAIVDDAAGFRRACADIFAALGERIHR